MKKLKEVFTSIPELNPEVLDRWIDSALIELMDEAGNQMVSDTQFARVRLIYTLHYDMDVEEETLPLVLDLLDQLHETRQRVHKLSQAVLMQKEDVRASVLEVLSKDLS